MIYKEEMVTDEISCTLIPAEQLIANSSVLLSAHSCPDSKIEEFTIVGMKLKQVLNQYKEMSSTLSLTELPDGSSVMFTIPSDPPILDNWTVNESLVDMLELVAK